MQAVIPKRSIESESVPAYTAFHAGVAGLAHNEAAFHHFLSIERRRAERGAQSVLLVLVRMRVRMGRSARLEPAMATAVFSALGASVRDADFIGWFREDRVAAAVLTHHPAPRGRDLPARHRASDRRASPAGAERSHAVPRMGSPPASWEGRGLRRCQPFRSARNLRLVVTAPWRVGQPAPAPNRSPGRSRRRAVARHYIVNQALFRAALAREQKRADPVRAILWAGAHLSGGCHPAGAALGTGSGSPQRQQTRCRRHRLVQGRSRHRPHPVARRPGSAPDRGKSRGDGPVRHGALSTSRRVARLAFPVPCLLAARRISPRGTESWHRRLEHAARPAAASAT